MKHAKKIHLKVKSTFTVILITLALTSCSMFRSKQQTILDNNHGASDSRNEDSTNPNEPNRVGSEKRKITLVLGGAGVSSFATVGILKRFHEEGIEIESIITTGWPTLFVLASGFLKSIHDVEWFAMRLEEKDFYKVGIFDPSKGYADHKQLSTLVESNFKQKEINESKYPIVISSANTEGDENTIYDRGDWREPLLKTMSVPGIFRPYPQGAAPSWIPSLQGIDVQEAKNRGGKLIVAVEMYGDYFDFLKSGKKDTSDGVFRQLYLSSLKKSIGNQLKEATLVGHIALRTSPTQFSQKRLAIFSGYKEAAQWVKAIRNYKY